MTKDTDKAVARPSIADVLREVDIALRASARRLLASGMPVEDLIANAFIMLADNLDWDAHSERAAAPDAPADFYKGVTDQNSAEYEARLVNDTAPLATPIDTTAPDEQRWDARVFVLSCHDKGIYAKFDIAQAAYTAGRLSRGMELPEEMPKWWADTIIEWKNSALPHGNSLWRNIRQKLSGGRT